MVFKSVPGTEVQFCIWETRVKDYAAYAAVNTSVDGEWKSPRFKQEDTHPVVKVSWNDAQAFCVWLTKKEVAAGKIKVGQRYRLPTDADWSVAVGLGKEVGKTPRNQRRLSVGQRVATAEGSGEFGPNANVDKLPTAGSVDRAAPPMPTGSFAANQPSSTI